MDEQTALEIARQCATRAEFKARHKTVWTWARDHGLLKQIGQFLPKSRNGPERTYTDQQLREDALRYPHRNLWQKAGEAERRTGVASHYAAANKRGPEFMARCTAHMTHALKKAQPTKRTEAELRESARGHSTLAAWKQADGSAYQAAHYQRNQHGREAFWAEITAHMVPAANPYAKDYYIYACLFHATRRAYIGLSYRPARRSEHATEGPAWRHMQESGAGFEWVILERDLPSPKAASLAEQPWHDLHEAEGWVMLNSARCGGLGALARLTKEDIRQRALDFETRGDFAEFDQSAHIIAKRNGWFEEVTAHMRSSSEVRSAARTGEKRSAEAKQKMREAKLGTTLSGDHKVSIGAASKSTWADPTVRGKRMDGIARAQMEGRMGRPSGWTLSADEAAHFGLAVGAVNLTTEQQKELRRFRYHRGKLRAQGGTDKISSAPPAEAP